MDPFVVIMVGGVGLVVAVVFMLGLLYPGSGADQLGWKSPRAHAEQEAARDSDDLAQLLEGVNGLRRARGAHELHIRSSPLDDGTPDD